MRHIQTPVPLRSRREFLSEAATALAAVALSPSLPAAAGPQLAVTMDDFNVLDTVHLPGAERGTRILAALRQHGANAMALAIGQFAATRQGQAVLDAWAGAGHVIGNHSYSHPDYHAASTSIAAFEADFARGDAVLRGRKGFVPFFRFPMLREGDTADKRDAMRGVLRRSGYRDAAVTIDNSDFLIDGALRAALQANPRLDTRPYRDVYIRHMRAFARYFRDSARGVFDRDIPHVLLTHFNLLSALHLSDLLDALTTDGWSFIPARAAYADEVYRRQPDVLPAGDSLVWSCARESGRPMAQRPIEDDAWLTSQLEGLR